MSSSPSSFYWCYSCHNIIRIPSAPSLSCPSCGFGFVEELSSEPRFLVISGIPSLRDAPASGDGGFGELSSYSNGRSSSSTRGFLRRLFRSSRSSRQTSENSPSLLQLLEAASLLQRSRDAENRDESADGMGSQGAPVRLSSMTGDVVLPDTEDVPGIHVINGEERSSVNADVGVDTRVERSRDDMRSQRPFDVFLQRLFAGILQSRRYGSLPASKAAVAAMPTFKISKQSLESGGCDDIDGVDEGIIECAVCKEAFEIGGEVREMPCKHFYHSNCILPWLELHSSCPLCRREMPVDAEAPSSSSSRVEGTTASTAVGEPTLVFIGISGRDALLFSFILLGSGNRNEPTHSANEEGEQNRHVSSISEEVIEGEAESERGETRDADVVVSSSDVSAETLPMDGKTSSEIDNIEQITEQRNSLIMRNKASISQDDRNLQSRIHCGKETKRFQETSGTSVAEGVAGPSSSLRDTTDSGRDKRLVTECQDGHSSAGRSRSLFSWFSRRAAARHMSTSSTADPSAEANSPNVNLTMEGCHRSDMDAL